jgi:shikimate dehydrogenase
MDAEFGLTALMKGPLPSLFFCIGDPVVGNPTQYMVEQAFRSLGFSHRYMTCTVEKRELSAAMWGLRALKFAGGNVTTPHKRAVLEYLDTLGESAMLCKAVNCITRRPDGTYAGDNTDGKGFLRSLVEETGSVRGKDVVVLGCGGAASAIAAELVLSGAKCVTVVNRTREKAVSLAKRLDNCTETSLAVAPWVGTYVIPKTAEIVVQATSVGLFAPDRCVDVSFDQARKDLVACDVVFNPTRTLFLKRAKERGLRCIDGLGMLVNQGALAIEQWTGRMPDRALMREALAEAFSILGDKQYPIG